MFPSIKGVFASFESHNVRYLVIGGIAPGIDFDGAWERRKSVDVGGQIVQVLARADLIASKRASGRPVDLDDVRVLGENESEAKA